MCVFDTHQMSYIHFIKCNYFFFQTLMSFPREQKYTIKNMSLIPYYFLSPICPQYNTFMGDISQLESSSAL